MKIAYLVTFRKIRMDTLHLLWVLIFMFSVRFIAAQSPCPDPKADCGICFRTINVSELPEYVSASQGAEFNGDIDPSCTGCMDQSNPAHHCYKFRFMMDDEMFPYLQIHVGQGNGCQGELDGAYEIHSNKACTVLAFHPGSRTIVNFENNGKYIDIYLCLNSHAQVSLCNVAKSATPLSISLTSLSVYPLQYSNVITWSTAEEVNNDYFVVERSTDSRTWVDLGKVVGAGNSNIINRYSFIDDKPQNLTYYRLRQVNYDGSITLSQMVKIDREKSEMVNVFPNPADDKLYFSVKQPFGNTVSVRITDLSGDECFAQSFASDDIYSIDIKDFPNGMYLISIVGEGFSYAKKFVKADVFY
jgi:Secretion system C-terminal sorting domain